MSQVWHDLLFIHWSVSPGILQPLIAPGLELDLFDGVAWLGITPFWMSGVRLRGMPPLPGLSRFPELNVRTYVRREGRPGVWFLSLDATNPIAVRVARFAWHLPYQDARIEVRREGNGIRYRLERPSGIRFEAEYAPTGDVEPALLGSLAHWLTERYCLYARSAGALYRADIHHVPWPLQPARVRISRSDLPAAHGIELAEPPADVRFSKRLAVAIWKPVRVADP
jgi:uncharacterized protein YqjF (DUF2071 family)